ncbi:2861_t:CDS:2 [Racocetra persica]|uniref:2861_t:CDS:1 n=1 Tax=Racocetra persica TaxID=160502 RepID=A0ACA9Q1R7_9GLOM|nr:2861_t:CDS:2 [Racocetra persica]
MSKKIFNCKNCQQKYNKLKDWEVKKRVALENGSYHAEICCTSSYKHNQEECLSARKNKPSDSNENDKKNLEIQINAALKGLKAAKKFPKNHPSFNEYDRQLIEERLNKLKKEYIDIQQLEATTNRTPAQEQELQEKRQELSRLENQQQSGGGGSGGNPKKSTNY